jgi:hypothetical protein
MSSSTEFRLGGLAAIIGGVLWALFPVGSVFVSLEGTQPGTTAHLAAATLLWLMAVVPLLLLLVGLRALHTLLKGAYGQLGNAGFLVSFVALVLMFLGNAGEMATLTFSGAESDTGHLVFLIGFVLPCPLNGYRQTSADLHHSRVLDHSFGRGCSFTTQRPHSRKGCTVMR